MKIIKITRISPQIVYALQTSTGTFVADGLAHHNCDHCNRGLKGNPRAYNRFMVDKYGQEEVDRLDEESKKTVQFKIYELKEMQEHYKQLIGQLESNGQSN